MRARWKNVARTKPQHSHTSPINQANQREPAQNAGTRRKPKDIPGGPPFFSCFLLYDWWMTEVLCAYFRMHLSAESENQYSKRSETMGDKGGKKDKDKSQKQSNEKQKHKEQEKVEKQPKKKAWGLASD